MTTPAPHHSVFLQAGCPSCRPTNSVKALKAVSIKNNKKIKKQTTHLPAGFVDRVCFVYEVIAVRKGWLMLGNHDFSREEMDEVTS